MNYCRFLGLLAAASLACAGPITFTFSGTINGSVDGVGFTNAPFTFVQSSDTTQILVSPGVVNQSFGVAETPFQNGANITIGGFGTGTISTDTFVFATYFDQSFDGPVSHTTFAGFLGSSDTGFIQVYGFGFPFGDYDLLSPIGPISSIGAFAFSSSPDVSLSSTLGEIILQGDPVSGSIPDLTFTATGGVPEPGTASLLLAAALFLLAARAIRSCNPFAS
jgi:hypothetical protein